MSDTPIKILFLSANPYADLPNLDTEFRRVSEVLEGRREFQIISRDHVFAEQIQPLLLEIRPHILHFAGHGTSRGELVTQHPQGGEQYVPLDRLAEVLRALRDKVPTRIVVLNACWTLERAEALCQEVDAVVGMTDAIDTKAAAAFAASFYRTLVRGESILQAMADGKAQAGVIAAREADVPAPRIRDGIDPQSIRIHDGSLISEALPPRWGDTPEPETREPLPPLDAHIISKLLSRFPRELGTIYAPDEKRRISEGLSGAVVYHVTIQAGKRATSAFAKFDAMARVSREGAMHKAVRQSAIGPFVPALLCEPLGPEQGWGMAIYQPGGKTVTHAASYHTVLNQKGGAARKIGPLTRLLEDTLGAWHKDIRTLLRLENGDLPPRSEIPNLLAEMLNLGGRIRTGQRLSERATEHHISPELAVLHFDDLEILQPNPFAYALRETLWRDKGAILRLDAPHAPVHGDLHGKNIICLVDDKEHPVEGESPWLIDFGQSHWDRNPFFDLAYLEIDLLLHLLPANRGSRQDWAAWIRMTGFLAEQVLPTSPERLDHDTLEQLWQCIAPIRHRANALIQVEQNLTTRRHFERAFWLGAVAAGLMVTRRSRMEPPEKHKVTLLYAARMLRQLRALLNLPRPNEDAYRITWGEPPQAELAIGEMIRVYYEDAKQAIIRNFRAEFETLESETIPNLPGGEAPHPEPPHKADRRDSTADPAVAAIQRRLGLMKGGAVAASPEGGDASKSVREALSEAKAVDVLQTLLETPRAVLIGDPGGGKTVMLEQLMVACARRPAGDSAQPVAALISLAKYQGDRPFADYAHDHLLNLRPYADRLPIVWLLDGLNEMSTKHVPAVVKFIQDELARPVGRRFVLSCRIKDYEGLARQFAGISDLRLVEIRPLLPAQIKAIIDLRFGADKTTAAALWQEMLQGQDEAALFRVSEAFAANDGHFAFWEGSPNEAPGGTGLYYVHDDVTRAALKEKWDKNDGKRSISDYPAPYESDFEVRKKLLTEGRQLMAMCRNPYTLNLLIRTVRVMRGVENLPAGRAALYAAFAEGMLAHELDERGKRGESVPARDAVWSALARMAEAIQATEQRTEIAEAEALRAVGTPDAEYLLRVAEGAGLLDYRDTLRFTHQLLQEYFAVETLLLLMADWESGKHPLSASRLFGEAWWETPAAWRETLGLLAEVVESPEKIARWLAPVSPEAALGYLPAQPDGEAARSVEAGTADPVRQAILQSAQAKAEYDFTANTWRGVKADPRGRAAAWRVLGNLRADSRPGVLDFHWGEDYWCHVPAGEYSYQGKPEKIDYDFWIAKYPVTYVQFQLFIDAPDGYRNPDWWKGLAMPEGHNKAPAEQRFKVWNHPREMVSWYEAVAFSRWVNALTPRRPAFGVYPLPTASLGEGEKYEIRLPLETEWEKAASWDTKAGKARVYPWEGEFDPTKANTGKGNSIGQTTAVGIYPQGAAPCGALDMSGNVWEWCLNEYGSGKANIGSGATRALRGGSWPLSSVRARAASRSGNDPSSRYDAYGCRLVVVVLRPPSQFLNSGRPDAANA